MSLLDEMRRHGLAYCEFNNQLMKEENKMNKEQAIQFEIEKHAGILRRYIELISIEDLATLAQLYRRVIHASGMGIYHARGDYEAHFENIILEIDSDDLEYLGDYVRDNI